MITFVVSSIIQWLLFNYTGNKNKSTPSGLRIHTLSTELETLVNKVSSSDEAVSLCLPILMKQILSSDYKLRDLISNNKINNHRAIALQGISNQLFLSFFKTWVHSD